MSLQSHNHTRGVGGGASGAPRYARQSESNSAAPVPPREPAELADARPKPFPEQLEPQLATLFKKAPEGDDWLHEVKYDGYRILALKQNRVRLLTRNGKDWTFKFPAIADALAELPEAVVDGELVYRDSQGISSFEKLQSVLKTGQTEALVFYAFDLPYLDGHDLSKVPLIERKQILAGIISELNNKQIQFSDHIEGSGSEVARNACQHGLEGIISKKRDSAYTSTRAKTWRKIKCGKRQEFVVVGYTAPSGSRQGFGALLLGYYEKQGAGKETRRSDRVLRYAGKVGTGFNHQQLGELRERLEKLTRKNSALSESTGEKQVTWVAPRLVAEVEFTEWTAANKLRHPSFVSLRGDKPPADIVKETPIDQEASGQRRAIAEGSVGGEKKHSASNKQASRSAASANVAGVTLTNPNKVLYANAGFTKRDLANFYLRVADVMLPFVENRPLTLVRCPRGHTRHCFFQKHPGDAFSSAIGSGAVKLLSIAEKDGRSQYAYINSAEGLVELVQMGTLEIHAWGCRVDDIEKPDQAIFDLDPDPGIKWVQITQAAVELRDFLQELGLQSFLRTSGGKGLHVVVPLQRRHSWDQVKAFTKAVAQAMATLSPERYTANMSKAKRKNKIFIDYLRNARGATSICNYSTRSRDNAPVAVPVDWDEVSRLKGPDAFRLDNTLQHLNSRGTCWSDYNQVRQSINQTIRRRLKLD